VLNAGDVVIVFARRLAHLLTGQVLLLKNILGVKRNDAAVLQVASSVT
jgi:hypothetical protein